MSVMVEMTKEDANNLDEVVHELGIEDDLETPAEAVRRLKALHRNQAETIKAFQTKIEHLELALIQAERSCDGWVDINAEAGKALTRLNNRVGELTMLICKLTSGADSVIRTDAGGNQHRMVSHKALEALAAAVSKSSP